MEAPTLKKLSCSVTSDKNWKYNIELFSNSDRKLQITIKSIDNISNTSYEEKFSLDEIKKLGKYFLMCDTIAEVIVSLEPYFQNDKKIELLEKENYLNLMVHLEQPLCPNVNFKINIKQKNVSESIGEIYEILKKMQITINQQQNEINTLKETVQQLKLENNKIKQIKKEEEENNLNEISY